MKIKNVTESDMKIVMCQTNLQYGANVEFERFESIKNGFNFTLRVKTSKGLGHRLGFTGRKLVKACWDVHRDFMKNIFGLCPSAKIVSCRAVYDGIDDFQSKFSDTGYANIGSIMQAITISGCV